MILYMMVSWVKNTEARCTTVVAAHLWVKLALNILDFVNLYFQFYSKNTLDNFDTRSKNNEFIGIEWFNCDLNNLAHLLTYLVVTCF